MLYGILYRLYTMVLVAGGYYAYDLFRLGALDVGMSSSGCDDYP